MARVTWWFRLMSATGPAWKGRRPRSRRQAPWTGWFTSRQSMTLAKVADLAPESAAAIVSVNLTGSFHVAQLAPPLLRKGGQLAFCGSVAGLIGLPQGQIYSATKAGVINLAESLRAELAGRIDVRLINPGFVDTRMTRRNDFAMPALVTPETAARAIIRGLNSRRFETHFPRRLTLGMKLLAALPYWASLPLTRRLTR